MSSQVLYRKWRPQTLSEVVGQEHVTKTLLNALKTGKVAHAYLFCGPRGTGKTSTGRILAKAVNCVKGGKGEPCNTCSMCQSVTEGRAMDIIEIDAASNRGIDEIRELRERVRFSPGEARFKVYIIDEVHMLTDAAANALLKTLEEPPPHAIFILATTETHKVPLTILSRCQRFDFRRIPQAAMTKRLAEVCKSEGIEIDEAALNIISRSATGSMRDAENLLEQLAAQYGNNIDLNQVRIMLGISGDVRAHELAGHIVNSDLTAGLHTLYAITQDGVDLKQFCRELVEYLRGLILMKGGADTAVDAPKETLAEMKRMAENATMLQLSKAARLFREVEMQSDGFSSLPMELALVECTVRARDDRAVHAAPVAEKAEAPAVKAEKPVSTPAPAAPVAEKPAPTPAPAVPVAEKPKATPRKAKAAKPAPESADVTPVGAIGQSPLPESPSPDESDKIIEKKESKAAPVATAPTDPAAAAKEPAGPINIEILRKRWGEVIKATKGMGSRGNLDALLRSACEPVSVNDDTIVLGFYYEFHKEKIEDPKYRHMVEAKVKEIFGSPYKLRCIIVEKKEKAKSYLVDEALKMGAMPVDEENE
ncbi:MAG: DNA polymerase III subunit gamma/tau [Dehalococcoidia bacterium]|jgi:DNA polymerase-3 subunit gamma/tau